MKLILGFSIPLLFGNLFQQFYSMVDTMIVGRVLGTGPLAAVGSTGSITFLIIGFCLGLCSGFAIPVAQRFGSRDYKELRRFIGNAVWLCVGFGIVLTVLTVIFCRNILELMGTPADIIDDAYAYLVVIFAGIPATFLYNMLAGIQRAIGDSRMPLYVLIVCCLANVVLDLLFVVVFHWGVFGVAFATILSQLISAVLLMIRLMGTQEAYRVELRKIRFHKDILKNVVRIGLPAGLQSVMYSFSNILIQASINSFGTTAIAAWAAIGKIDGFIWMVMNAFGIAVTTFAGQNFGARQYDRMKRCTRVGLGMCLGTIIALSALLFIFRYQLLMFFTGDAEVVNIGAQFYLVLAPSYFTFVFIEILSGAIRGAGEALQPMLITCIGVCGLRVVWILLVVPYWHTMQMVAMNYPVSWVITAVIFVIYYLRGKWLDRCIKREHDPQHGTATEA